MGTYTVIADVGQALVKLFQSRMVPEVIPKKEQIGLSTPKEVGNYRLGICLYDVQESSVIRNEPKRWCGENIRTFPPMYLDLYYMLIPYSNIDRKYRATEEQKILGSVIRVMRDFPLLNPKTYETEESMGIGTLQMEIQNISFEEKTKIWNSMNEAMQNAVYCKVNSVELESARHQQVQRVQDIEIRFGQGGHGNGS